MRNFALAVLFAAALPTKEPAGEISELSRQEPARAAFDHTHQLFDELLVAHVKGDWLDYQGVAKERAKLDRYLAALHSVTPEDLEDWTHEQRYAFWINVYNAHVIQVVLDHYPLRSIKDIGSLVSKVWDKEFIPMPAHHPKGRDEALSLDDVEHGILRPVFADARVHAAVNCGSYSCPPIAPRAFVAERLDEQLDLRMRAFVVDPLRNRFDEQGGVLYLSEIFRWFREDFEREADSVREYLIRFAPAEKADFIRSAKIKYLDYDWSLNDIEENRI